MFGVMKLAVNKWRHATTLQPLRGFPRPVLQALSGLVNFGNWRISLVLGVVGCAGCGCVSVPLEIDTRLGNLHEVTIEELLGNGIAFDGQPVRVIGVSNLGLEFEHRSELYPSREAFQTGSRQHLDVDFQESWYAQSGRVLASFRGKYVIVEGFFGYNKPSAIEPSPGTETICYPSCPTNGWLYDIRKVELLDR